jgi:DNA repair exonuclease SbcCD ATPase subunit
MSEEGGDFDPYPRDASAEINQERVGDSSAARLLGETFSRIQVRMEDLLSTVEDSLRSTDAGIDEQASSIIEGLSSKLKTAGLGVFATKAVSIANDEIRSGLSSEAVLAQVFETIGEAREEIGDIVTKASKGTVRTVEHTTVTLQSRLIRMHARLSEREKALEDTLATIKALRSRVAELETVVLSKSESMDESQLEISRLKQVVADLEANLESRDADTSLLKGELSQAQSQIEEQRALIKKLDSAEELVTDYEEKTRELSELRGKLAQANETISQRDATIERLREEVDRLSESAEQMGIRMSELEATMAVLRGERQAAEAQAEELAVRVAELKARWDMLYQVAEEEPAFKAYFLVADKKHWFELSHLSSALGVPVVLLKRQLQRFIDARLLELDGERIRPRNLSEVAQAAAGGEETLLEDARVDLDDSMSKERDGGRTPPEEKPETHDKK